MKPKVAIIYNSGSTSTSFIVMFYTLKDDGKLEYCGDPYDLETKEEVMDKIASEAPSVVQLSVSLFYGMMELLMRTRSCLPKARILVKASYWQDAERAQAFRNGANACIHDSLDTEKAIREILKEDLSGFLGLTHTEAEVLRHKRKGWLSKEIAAVMKCKLATVTSHLRNIYRKLGVNNQMEAIYLVFPPSWK